MLIISPPAGEKNGEVQSLNEKSLPHTNTLLTEVCVYPFSAHCSSHYQHTPESLCAQISVHLRSVSLEQGSESVDENGLIADEISILNSTMHDWDFTALLKHSSLKICSDIK